jgi:hypothetical protein
MDDILADAENTAFLETADSSIYGRPRYSAISALRSSQAGAIESRDFPAFRRGSEGQRFPFFDLAYYGLFFRPSAISSISRSLQRRQSSSISIRSFV